MKEVRKLSLLIGFMLCTLTAVGQSASWVLMRQGNKAFAGRNYQTAKSYYKKALEADPNNANALYNLGNVNMALQKDTALTYFDKARQISANPFLRAKAAHNQGVICQAKALTAEKEKVALLKQAINYYKNSLRDDPNSDATRYNLALCQKQLKDSNSNKNSPQKSPQNQPQEKKEKKEEEKQQQQNSMVNYARQAEQNTRRKMQKNATRRSLEKNW